MTLEELEKTLPNGLHDAEVRKITVDYELRKLTLDITVWVGNMHDPPERREAYRDGSIEISGLLFLAMELPDPKYPFQNSKLTIDGCDMRENLKGELVRSVPQDSFFRSLWVSEWNAFIHIAAREARLSWANEGAISYRMGQKLTAKGQEPNS